MRKISTIVVTLLLLVTLVACSKDKLFAKIEGVNVTSQEKTSFTFDIDLIDPDEQLEGGLKVYLEFDGKSVSEKSIDFKDDESKLENITFSSLEADKTYTIIIKGTFKAKPVNMYKGTSSTKKEETKVITTTDEFLALFDNKNKDSYTKYELANDLDFEGVDTSKRSKTTFNSEFDGMGFTIKNYTTSKNERYMGLFSRLLKGAHIHNLNIDKMSIATENDLTGDRDIGILFGKSSSTDVTVENIKITNSSIDVSVNSSSVNGAVNIGLVAGYAFGNYKDISVDENSKLNLAVNKYSNVKVGGIFGYTRDNVKLTEASVTAELNVTIEQDGKNIPHRTEKKEKLNVHFMYVGGVIGFNESTHIKSVISYVDINYSEVVMFASHETNETMFETLIGGIYGHSAYAFTNGLYSGDIKINTLDYELTEAKEETNAEDKVITKVTRNYYVGGIAGYYLGYFTEFEKVARSNSSITVSSLPDTINLKSNTLLGYVKFRTEYDEALPKFATNGTITDSANVVSDKVFTDVPDLKKFFDNEWIKVNIK